MSTPKINYQLKLDGILENLEGRPKLLLHSCCGPCSSYVMEYLEKYFQITVFYYNPCIDPDEEYEHRKRVQQKLISDMNAKGSDITFLPDVPYRHDEYLEFIRGHEADPEGGERCHMCYEQRMRAAAQYAKQNGYDYFCTTLSVSPYKNAQYLNEIGESLEAETGVLWLYSDFKKRNGYKRSIELSHEYDLYRQDYCGCEFSRY